MKPAETGDRDGPLARNRRTLPQPAARLAAARAARLIKSRVSSHRPQPGLPASLPPSQQTMFSFFKRLIGSKADDASQDAPADEQTGAGAPGAEAAPDAPRLAEPSTSA
ncbi:hypothetical protein G3N92_05805, partial [Burkholderia sp. Ac-20379]|nr:hypothetical protein [Burkholderia sp. Ac-20379]